MATVRVTFTAQLSVALPDGNYRGVGVSAGAHGLTTFSRVVEVDDAGTVDRQSNLAEELLDLVNRLLRWYRYLTSDFAVTELTQTRVGYFHFRDESGDPWGPQAGRWQLASPNLAMDDVHDPEQTRDELLAALAGSDDPPVWHLLLADAQLALTEGRYRESVLHSWSAIESCFGYHYHRWARARTDLSSDERQGLVGRDMSLANQMTAGLRFVAGQSLHELLGDDWIQRRRSYQARNAIVHEGQAASIADAMGSVAFAQRVIEVVEQLAAERRQKAADHA